MFEAGSVRTWFRFPHTLAPRVCAFIYYANFVLLTVHWSQTNAKRKWKISRFDTFHCQCCHFDERRRPLCAETKGIVACGILAKCSPIFNVHQQIHRQLSVFRKSLIPTAPPSHAQLAFATLSIRARRALAMRQSRASAARHVSLGGFLLHNKLIAWKGQKGEEEEEKINKKLATIEETHNLE